MKNTVFFTLCLALFAALSASAAFTQAIAYRGKLQAVNGTTINPRVPVQMDFKLYSKPSGGLALWGRRVPVKVKANGSFYVELSDALGKISGYAEYAALVDALAAKSDELYIGVTPVGHSELLPRMRVGTFPSATLAEKAANAERLVTPNLEAEGINAGTMSVAGNLTVTNRLSSSRGVIKLVVTKDMDIGSEDSVTHVSTLSFPVNDTGGSGGRAMVDLIAVYGVARDYGVFSLPVPKTVSTARVADEECVPNRVYSMIYGFYGPFEYGKEGK